MNCRDYRPGGKDYIYVNDDARLKVNDRYIEKLKKEAKRNNYSKLTMCLHNDIREHVHEMIQVYQQYEYVRPHFHPQKTETKIILEGKLLIVIYDINGNQLDYFTMSKEEGNIFMFRMDKGVIHTNIPLTDVVFQEITSGPYCGISDNVFPEWSCPLEDVEGIRKYMNQLLNMNL